MSASAGDKIVARMAELGIPLLKAPAPVANYLPYTKTRATPATSLLHLCGHLPKKDDGTLAVGKVGKDTTVEEASRCAALCITNMLATLNLALDGNLERVLQVVKINVFVNATDDCKEQPVVANGASDLLVKVFAERGRHARSAVGVASLPLGVPVEIDAIIEVEDVASK